MKNLQAIILAAGKGTRMKSRIPKILQPICGRELIEYVLDGLAGFGSLKTYIVVGHQKERIEKYFGGRYHIVHQKTLAGTADAVKCCASKLRGYKGNVLVLCGDAPLIRRSTIRRLLQKHRKNRADATILTGCVNNASMYGRIIRSKEGKVIAIREHKDATPEKRRIQEINTGCYCFSAPQLLDALKKIQLNKKKREYYLTDVIEILVAHGCLVETSPAADAQESFGVNTREDLALSEAIIRQRILKDFMLKGVTIVDPLTTFIHQNVKIGRDTTIYPFCYIEGDVRIGRDCSIGPFAHIRPKTRIADQACVGNFAEVSRSHIGRRSVMKHFGFLGDARVGAHVNIGAGTVTANYDGLKKNQTIIANNAFIGSDTVFVAPVKVGQGAATGAGCVIKKKTMIPKGRVIVGVPGKILDKKVKQKRSR